MCFKMTEKVGPLFRFSSAAKPDGASTRLSFKDSRIIAIFSPARLRMAVILNANSLCDNFFEKNRIKRGEDLTCAVSSVR